MSELLDMPFGEGDCIWQKELASTVNSSRMRQMVVEDFMLDPVRHLSVDVVSRKTGRAVGEAVLQYS